MIGSVSVDLDGLGCYAAIHGLPPLEGDDTVPRVALQRLVELFDGVKVPATFFVIGSDVPATLPGAPHEIASHSFAHDYAMSRWSVADIEADLAKWESAVGRRPAGFRAPGYTLSPALLEAVRRRGYAYDSSLLPSPPYYAAKAVALALKPRSRSILGGVAQLFAPRGPHLRDGVRELPVSCTPLLRLPVIGTSVLALPQLARFGAAGGHFNLELHGIDALDASDVPPQLARVQPGLATKASVKLQRLREVLRGGDWCTLEAASRRFFD